MMPLSKERNKKRMRLIRLRKAISSPQTSNPVQPKEGRTPPYKHPKVDLNRYERSQQSKTIRPIIPNVFLPTGREIDADGNVIYEE